MNLARSQILFRHPDPSDSVLTISVSSDGKLFASAGLLERIFIWSFSDGALLHTLNPEGPGEYINGIWNVQFHGSKSYLAYVTVSGRIQLVRCDDWRTTKVLADEDNYEVAFAFSTTGSYIAYGTIESNIVVFDVERECALLNYVAFPIADDDAYKDWIYAERLSFSSDSEHLSTLFRNGLCRIQSIPSGDIVKEWSNGPDRIAYAAFSPIEDMFLTVTNSGILVKYCTKNWTIIGHHDLALVGAKDCALCPSRPLVGAINETGQAVVWDYRAGVKRQEIEASPWMFAPIAFSRDGEFLMIGGEDGCVRGFSIE